MQNTSKTNSTWKSNDFKAQLIASMKISPDLASVKKSQMALSRSIKSNQASIKDSINSILSPKIKAKPQNPIISQQKKEKNISGSFTARSGSRQKVFSANTASNSSSFNSAVFTA